ncbi:MAG: DUF2203 domain-containing protein [Acidobacteria bacterium]|nr:DUF2203 domain-containing protein [Acidobacteriota bacterium]
MGDQQEAKRLFTLDEARALIPEVKRITQKAYKKVQRLTGDAENLPEDSGTDPALRQEVNNVITDWLEAVTGLGCDVKGLWLVDFDSGHGYYCWKYPEHDLQHYHSYEEGFSGRMRIL